MMVCGVSGRYRPCCRSCSGALHASKHRPRSGAIRLPTVLPGRCASSTSVTRSSVGSAAINARSTSTATRESGATMVTALLAAPAAPRDDRRRCPLLAARPATTAATHRRMRPAPEVERAAPRRRHPVRASPVSRTSSGRMSARTCTCHRDERSALPRSFALAVRRARMACSMCARP